MFWLLLGAGQANADGGPIGTDVHVAQTLGERELTVVIRRVTEVPGPLSVDVITHAGTAPGRLDLAASFAGTASARTQVELGATPGTYGATMTVDRAGPWELAVSDGTQVARIPFVVPAQVPAPWEKAAYGGFVAAGVLLLVALYAAVRARRSWHALLPATGVVAALAVAITAALLSSSIPPPARDVLDPTVDTVNDPYAPLPSTMDTNRPPLNLAVSGTPAGFTLRLTDSATGRPADDLVVHHNALVHLVAIGPSGRLWHLHPVRTAPGTYTARFGTTETGRFALSAEVARRGGGTQLLRSTLDTEGGPGAPEPVPGLGTRTIDGVPVTVHAGEVRANAATAMTAKFGDTGTLQPWLGMTGHLMVVGPLPDATPVGAATATAPTWAHVHSMTGLPVMSGRSAAGQPDETVAAYGPEVRFTYTFPAPGRYRLWFQGMRDYAVITAPVELDVPEGDRP
ncbi:hypothetical protein A4R43_27480 [Amycolatopsis albispora]|uniref:Uncharacterized protein n=1 Tax=Amycolatopsis albispora TaxID=1804986 RepID=A0A344LLC0_9PSEU|nr:hypothetical protein A4R43_27480 [Amycolatopsis albispora]